MTTGSCLCGTVRWRIDGPLERMTNCHCTMCRKAHGAPFATFIVVPESQFTMLDGAEAVAAYESSDDFTRQFCSRCGSPVPFSVSGRRGVPAGCLDEDPGIRPQRNIFVADKAPWYEIADSLPQFERYDFNQEPVAPAPRPGPAETPEVLHGSCLCGGVAFEAKTPIMAVYHCHCIRCQKARGAAHTTNAFVDPKGVTFTRGEELLERYKVPEARFFTQAFCRVCGSIMPHVDLSRDRVGIQIAALDEDPGIGVGYQIYCDFKAPWFEITDGIPQIPEGTDGQIPDGAVGER